MIFIPIGSTFSLKREAVLKPGVHEFIIDDIRDKRQHTDSGDVTYLVFDLTETGTLKKFDNLLSAPVSKRGNYSELSKLSTVLTRFGANVKDNETLLADNINKLIGSKFNAVIVYNDDGFARIDEKTIIPIR